MTSLAAPILSDLPNETADDVGQRAQEARHAREKLSNNQILWENSFQALREPSLPDEWEMKLLPIHASLLSPVLGLQMQLGL